MFYFNFSEIIVPIKGYNTHLQVKTRARAFLVYRYGKFWTKSGQISVINWSKLNGLVDPCREWLLKKKHVVK